MSTVDPAASRVVADEVKTSTCYMCACRCGIRVYLKDGTVRYIEGNPEHPVNRGVLCAKGSAGIMQHYSPARLTKPLKRVGDRGEGQFEEIEWDEALTIAADWLGQIRKTDPKALAFFTGRDQSQSLTGWWAQQFGTPNHAAHGGFCSVNMAAAGLYSIGGAFWEFGEADWDHTRYFMMFGVAEDHDSNPIKMGLGKLKSRPGTKFVSVNPVRTGYSAIADEWVGIRPGTDGLFVAAIIHELLRAEQIDWDYLARYTNATWLVIQDPEAADHGTFYRDPTSGQAQCFDGNRKSLTDHAADGAEPRFVGEFTSADGRPCVPAFQLLAQRYLDEQYAPSAVAERTGVSAEQIERIAAELAEAAFEQEITIDTPWVDWTGQRHEQFVGRPVSMHAMRGISAHANGFHTCRAIHVLQMLLGTIDVPGGFRYKPPFPKHIPPAQKPSAAAAPGEPLTGLPLGFPSSPADLLVNDDGSPQRLDKAFSWEYPLALHGMMHMVIHNAWAGDPYPIDTLFMYMANMAWNSSMNVPDTLRYLTDKDPATGEYKIPRFIYSDAYYSETVAYADLVLPDTTYLERWDCISLMDRPIGDADGPADSIRQPVVEPDRDVRPFQDVLLELGVRIGLPGMCDAEGKALYPQGYPDYIANHMRTPKVGPLAGFRGADGQSELTGPANPKQLDAYIKNGCFWRHELTPNQRYMKFANWDYLAFANDAGWIGSVEPIVLQLYSEPLQRFRLAAEGKGERQPPAELRDRIQQFFDPLPITFDADALAPSEDKADFPVHALTQRPMHMYHSWGSQNAWLRQITDTNVLYVHPDLADRYGIADNEWAWVVSRHGRVKARVQHSRATNPHTVWTWNAIGKRQGFWGLDPKAPESTTGFLLNHIIPELLPPRADGYRYSNSDPVTGQAAWFDLTVTLEKCDDDQTNETVPRFADSAYGRRFLSSAEPLRFGADLTAEPSGPALPEHREFVGNLNAYHEQQDD